MGDAARSFLARSNHFYVETTKIVLATPDEQVRALVDKQFEARSWQGRGA